MHWKGLEGNPLKYELWLSLGGEIMSDFFPSYFSVFSKLFVCLFLFCTTRTYYFNNTKRKVGHFLLKSIAEFIIESTNYLTFIMKSLQIIYYMTVSPEREITPQDGWALVSGYCFRGDNKVQSQGWSMIQLQHYDTDSLRKEVRMLCQIFPLLLFSGHDVNVPPGLLIAE